VAHSRIEAQKKEVGISFHCPGHGAHMIHADPLMINRVITNLLDNAVKYTHRGGPVTVTLLARDEDVLIQVSDQGVGIEEEHLPYIFDAFYRVRKEKQGSGLGLAIAKTIVEAHGGKIWVESVYGQGSTFSVILPTQSLSETS
jgi:signal transduction histidine kinase